MTDSNNTNDVFISDISTSGLTRISTPTGASGPGNGFSDSPVISHDGNRIVFRSAAGNLTDGDTNGLPDIFVYDRVTGTTRLLSRHPVTGASANGASSRPRISANGRRIAFESMASDLVPQDHNQEVEVFVTSVTSATSLTFATLTPGPDGRLRWSLQGEPGAQVVLQSSTYLNTWTPLSTNLLPAEVEVNPATGGDLLLLRAVQGNCPPRNGTSHVPFPASRTRNPRRATLVEGRVPHPAEQGNGEQAMGSRLYILHFAMDRTTRQKCTLYRHAPMATQVT
jgi:hypothetical protein